MAGESGVIRRVLALGFVVAAFAAAVVIYVKYAKPAISPPGSSDADQVWLQCQKCGAEFTLTSEQFNGWARDPATGDMRCKKCGEMSAQLASLRCPYCKKLIVRQPQGAAFVCPHCKKSLAVLGGAPREQ